MLPAKLPRAVPAARPVAMRQSTLPNLACCARPTHDGATMASKELPSTPACKKQSKKFMPSGVITGASTLESRQDQHPCLHSKESLYMGNSLGHRLQKTRISCCTQVWIQLTNILDQHAEECLWQVICYSKMCTPESLSGTKACIREHSRGNIKRGRLRRQCKWASE